MYNSKHNHKKQTTQKMTYKSEQFPSRTIEQSRQPLTEMRQRQAGSKILNRVDVQRPGSERQLSLTDQLRAGARGAAMRQLNGVREMTERKTGQRFPLNADVVRAAYLAQRERLKDESITDDMTRKQLTNELIAKAILFAPQASDALRTHKRHESKIILSQYNDVLGEIIRSLPPHLAPGYKSAIMDTIKFESLALNKQIGHSSEISGKDDHGLEVLRTMVNGASYEIAPENALYDDPNLEVIIPKDTQSDLEGIDMMVRRISDGKVINIDTKGHGKYLSTVAKLQHKDWVDEGNVGPYFFTKIHENGHPHYLLNAGAFGDIPADNFDYDEAGQEKVRQIVHRMLDE